MSNTKVETEHMRTSDMTRDKQRRLCGDVGPGPRVLFCGEGRKFLSVSTQSRQLETPSAFGIDARPALHPSTCCDSYSSAGQPCIDL
jgi:hypothetical protein